MGLHTPADFLVSKAMEPFEEMELQDQKKYLPRMLIILANKITMMETNALGRPTTVNVTPSMKKGKIVKFMFGASVRSGIQTGTITNKENSKSIAMSRVRTIPILQWCHSNVAQTRKESDRCNYSWCNCAESVPWRAMHGRKRSQRHRVVLWSIYRSKNSGNHVSCSEG